MKKKDKSQKEPSEVEKLRAQLAEAQETLRAIGSGEVDALVVSGKKGEQVFTLKGAEQPYRILIEEMSEGAAMLAADDSILYCNNGFAGMLKMPLEKLMGTAIEHYITPSNDALFFELLRQGKEGRSVGEITMLAKDGTFVPVHISFSTLQMDDARLVYLVATDLTGQKRIRDELRNSRDELEIRVEERTAELQESEKRWSTILSSIGDAVISTDVKGRITFMNAMAETLTGWTFADALTKQVTEVFNIINECTRQEADNPVSKVLKEGKIVGLANHTILLRKDGIEIPIDESGAPIRDADGKTMGVALVFRDVTEHKRAEEKLQESEEKYRNLIETSPIGISLSCPEDKALEVNPSWLKIFGYDPDTKLDFITRPISSFYYDPEERTRFLEQVKHGPVRDFETRFRRRDGSVFWGSLSSIAMSTPANKILLINTFQDISERKQVEEALRKGYDDLDARVRERTAELNEANKTLLAEISERKQAEEKIIEQATLLDKAHDAIALRNLEQNLIYWNKGAEYLYGWTAEEAIGKNADMLLYKGKTPNLLEAEKRVLNTGAWTGEFRQVTKDGKEIIVESRWTLIYDSENKPKSILVINTDITEKKKIESQFLRAQRMESIGTLAGGIAHDLNNMLTPMMLSLQILKEKFKDEQSQKLLTILENNSQRGADLVKQVLSFARGVEGERNPLQAKHIITEIEKVTRETFPRNIQIRTDIQNDLQSISGDATQLNQVMMNLCVNARDAMPEGGILNISAENSFIIEKYEQIHTEAKVGPYVAIAVSDTGIGIPPEIMDRIFEPFFTTKEFGKAPGLVSQQLMQL
ncbi:MAG: PAS domain S-box protein [Candidatus Methanoperedens sp.]|nr:PAS domain S-box protein [Candidatus Methanoperedens sp.]